MKRVSVVIFSLLVGFVIAGQNEKYSDVALINVGNVDSNLFERVKSYIEDQYLVEVVVRDAVENVPETATKLQKAIASTVKPSDICLLALSNLPATEHQGVIFKDDRCGIINIAALNNDVDGDKDEVVARRVEKESLRAIAVMIDIPACPSFRCALMQHKNDKQLDAKSRNPCPPCLEKIRNKLREDGLKIKNTVEILPVKK